jgi:hypothetical protein
MPEPAVRFYRRAVFDSEPAAQRGIIAAGGAGDLMRWTGLMLKFAGSLLLVMLLLTGMLEFVNAADWLPGRGSLAFVSDRDGNREIYLMDLDRPFIRRLTDNPGIDLRPTWSPDGKQIAFYSNRDGAWNLYVMRASGRDVRQITQSGSRDRNPRWSPDGTLLAFDSTRNVNSEIFVTQTACLDRRLEKSAFRGGCGGCGESCCFNSTCHVAKTKPYRDTPSHQT